MTSEKHQQWQLVPEGTGIETVLLAFVARRIMRVTAQRPGLIEVKGGSALAVGKRGKALDWLPVRGRISFGEDSDGYTRVEASIRRRGRPHVRRRTFAGLYEQKLSSWMAELDRTLKTSTQEVRETGASSAAMRPRGQPASDGLA